MSGGRVARCLGVERGGKVKRAWGVICVLEVRRMCNGGLVMLMMNAESRPWEERCLDL